MNARFASTLLALASGLAAAERPNIVIILADDYGYGSAGCYGADPRLIRTPAIDRLAREGRRFTDALTTSSVCSPTRYSLLTGRYCWRTALKSEVLGVFSPLHIETNRLTLASLLKRHGYATAAIGKWHLGYGVAGSSPAWRVDYAAELSPGPLDIGFDYHFGVPSNHGDITGVFVENRFVFGLRAGRIPPGLRIPGPADDDEDFQPTYGPEDTERGRGPILSLDAPRRRNQRVMKVLTDRAVAWLEKRTADEPFFLYFAPVAVHNPVTPSDDLAGHSAAGPYGDWIHELDRSVGRILDALDRTGAARTTLVMFTSDNGGVVRPTNTNSVQTAAYRAGLRINGDLRGGKHDIWEGGFRVPFLARWPGRIPAGTTCHATISLVDVLATTAALLGEPLPPPSVAAEDSRSFLPALLGQADAAGRDDVIEHNADGVFALRRGPWKWIEGVPAASAKGVRARTDQNRPQLYHLASDPAETNDVAAAHPDIVREMAALLRRYRDGGYSRELPPEAPPSAPTAAALPPLNRPVRYEETFARLPGSPWSVVRGTWTPRDGGLWGAQSRADDQGACLRAPCGITNGAVEFQICFAGANRHSLRIECAGGAHSFRVELARSYAAITKNPSAGEDRSKTEALARTALELANGQWHTVRILFQGAETTVYVGGAVLRAAHEIMALPKPRMNFLVFGASAGFRNLKVCD